MHVWKLEFLSLTVEFLRLSVPAAATLPVLSGLAFMRTHAPSQDWIEQITLCFHSGSKRRILSVWNGSTRTHTLTEMCSPDCAVVIEVTAELLASLAQPTGLGHKALNTRLHHTVETGCSHDVKPRPHFRIHLHKRLSSTARPSCLTSVRDKTRC